VFFNKRTWIYLLIDDASGNFDSLYSRLIARQYGQQTLLGYV